MQRWEFSERNLEFGTLYLKHTILVLYLVSIVTVVSRSALPKVLNIVGIALWMALARNHRQRPAMKLHSNLEHLLIIAGLLYLVSVESIGVPHPLLGGRAGKENEPQQAE